MQPELPDPLIGYFMPNAITVAGLQHITNTVLQEVHGALSHWDTFWHQLKALEALLQWQHRRRRFVSCCVLQSPFAHKAPLFEHFRSSAYEKRWHEVLRFVLEIRPLLSTLRLTWDSQRFNTEAVHQEATAGAFTDALSFGYVDIVSMTTELPEQLAFWGEGCLCHDLGPHVAKPHIRARMLSTHFGQPRCPMAGKRAPELAAGRLDEVVTDVCELSHADMLSQPRPLPMSSSQSFTLVNNIEQAKGHIVLLITSKCDYWRRLPWLLCGLAHHCPQVASTCASRALQEFVESPSPDLHHRVTVKFLVGPLRDDAAQLAPAPALHN